MLTDQDLEDVNSEFLKWMNAKEEAAGSGRRILKFRTTWGPNAKNMTKDELLSYLIEVDSHPKIAIDPKTLDNGRPKVDVREWIKENQ